MPANATRIAPCVCGCGKLLENKPMGRFRACDECNAARRRRNRSDYYAANKDKEKVQTLAWRASNLSHALAIARKWKAENKQRVRDYKNKRLRESPAEVLNNRMRAAMNQRFRIWKGGRSWQDMVGYTPEELAAHLERQFVKGMGWDNVGQWHIDHIVPLASFQFESADDPEFRRAWSLANLRPLWGRDNRQKHAKRTHLV